MTRAIHQGYDEQDFIEAGASESLSARDHEVIGQVVREIVDQHARHEYVVHPLCWQCRVREGVECDDMVEVAERADLDAALHQKITGTGLTQQQYEHVGKQWADDLSDRAARVRYAGEQQLDEVVVDAVCEYFQDLDHIGWNTTQAKASVLARAARFLIMRKKTPPTGALAEQDAPPFDAGTLLDIRNRPPEPAHRIEELMPSDAGTLVVAQRKSGKTTLLLNVANSLLTGEPFLGKFGVRPINGTVALLNYEVSGRQVQRWADDMHIPEHRLFLVNLRGTRNPLGDPADRARLASLLRSRQTESLLVDPFGRAYTGASQNDAGEVGAWLADLDRFARGEVGATDLVLAAHAGWQGDRARGSTALEDWADSILTMTKNDTDDTRWLRAIGRDVDVDEDALSYDPTNRRLTLTGSGSRRKVAGEVKVAHLVPFIVDAVTTTPGMGVNEITNAVRANPHAPTFQDRDINKAARLAVDDGLIRVEKAGNGGKNRHYPPTTSNHVQTTSVDAVHQPRPTTSIYGRGGGLGRGPAEDTLDAVTCNICSAELWAEKSRNRGTCEKCARITKAAS